MTNVVETLEEIPHMSDVLRVCFLPNGAKRTPDGDVVIQTVERAPRRCASCGGEYYMGWLVFFSRLSEVPDFFCRRCTVECEKYDLSILGSPEMEIWNSEETETI